MKKNYSVRIGDYTNKKNVTKPWLFVEIPGQDWGNVLLNADQCAAILANADKLRLFIAQQQAAEQAKAAPTAPEPEPQDTAASTPDDATTELVQQINNNPALAAALATLAKSHTNIAGTASRNGNGKHSLARR